MYIICLGINKKLEQYIVFIKLYLIRINRIIIKLQMYSAM